MKTTKEFLINWGLPLGLFGLFLLALFLTINDKFPPQ